MEILLELRGEHRPGRKIRRSNSEGLRELLACLSITQRFGREKKKDYEQGGLSATAFPRVAKLLKFFQKGLDGTTKRRRWRGGLKNKRL